MQDENEKLKKAAEQYSTLQADNELLEEQKSQFSKLRTNLENQIKSLKEYKKGMQDSLQLISRNMVLEKYVPDFFAGIQFMFFILPHSLSCQLFLHKSGTGRARTM